MYFLIFQTKDMLKLGLNFNESQPVYAYKRYGYKKDCISYDLKNLCSEKVTRPACHFLYSSVSFIQIRFD